MTSPRRQIVDPVVPGFYHCVSRCVRRAFLCGQDAYTGQDFEHRKAWVEQRLLELARWFSVGVYAYAVMSNHLHIVVHIDPASAAAWSPEEVARRWVGVFPVCVDGVIDERACDERARAIAGDPARSAACPSIAGQPWLSGSWRPNLSPGARSVEAGGRGRRESLQSDCGFRRLQSRMDRITRLAKALQRCILQFLKSVLAQAGR